MKEFEKIMEEMEKRGIVPRIRYELMLIRALKVVAVVLIVLGVVWIAMK